ncbi:MAG: hypothetical protein QOD53_2150 [Thermoleophilaceae bacterium]|jgi:asparagine synthase (glutamine-hydrolysing)|nr:hypothetical protein [Thermoleophilaceae bacterium]
MCGIAGKLDWSGPVDGELLERMCSVLEHRGPDSRGTFLDDGVGLGVQRLAIIDLENGDQPIFNEDRSVVVVLNGEIYNYRELREELAARGHRLATASDTEVIVHLYEEHGDACVEHLRGMFAFALWDRSRRRLLLARDRIGKKPLFYARRGDRLWFASEAKAILEDDEVPRDIDAHAIDSFLHYQYVPQPRSAFAALRKLPAAHVLSWQGGDVTTRRYWKLSYRPELARVPEPELHEMIREQLLEATRLRLRSDVPVGALLSGGVDSSAVVAAVSRLAPGRLKTFSIGFDVPEYDETAYSGEVAELYGTDHHELEVRDDALAELPRIVWHHGEPFADPAAIPIFQLARLAGGQVKVALTGDGGDESFAGYERYDVFAPDASLRQRLGARMLARSTHLRARDNVLALYTQRISYGYFNDEERTGLYEPAFLGELGERDWLSVIADPYRGSDAQDALGRILDTDTQTYLSQDILVNVDIASMAHSLEVRSPLLDHELMQMAAAIPTDRKLAGGRSKRIFKDALRDWLPPSLLDRPKWGFSVPLCEWLRGPQRHLTEDILLDPRTLERGFFRPDAVRRLVAEHLDETWDHAGKLWVLMQLETWLRTYVDQPRIATPLTLPAA